MQVSVVWVDREMAKLFHVSEDRMQREYIKESHVEHHTHRREGDELNSLKMYREVAERLRGKKRILIVGPGLAKTHLLHHLEAQFPEIAKQVVGCETVDHPTDSQIAALALQYFNKMPGKRVS